MEKGKKIEAIDDHLELPEAIIQKIQCSLSGKEAASTAVLSKAWYNSWLTRPTLDFDERYFHNQNQNQHPDPLSDEKFLNFVTRSMERYHESNLNIESFNLWMNVRDIESYSLAFELIVNALKMGANGVNVEFNPPITEYLLPDKVFEAKSLVALSAIGCKILGEKVFCSKLNSLRLHKVFVDDDTIRHIISGCPLIENLFLSDCEGLLELNLSKMVNLKRLTVIRHVTKPVSFRNHLHEFEELIVGSITDDRKNVPEFRFLSYVLLERVSIDSSLFSDFSAKFPCIEDLTVRYCDGYESFDISSHSLKYITLAHTKTLEIQLDVPNIKKFKFTGPRVPYLSMISSSNEWESDIVFGFWNCPSVSFFLELKTFLSNLSVSKIYLSIELFRGTSLGSVPNLRNFPKPVLENLILKVHSLKSVSTDLVDGIFWACRPKVISQRFFPILHNIPNIGPLQHESSKASNLLLQLICNKLIELEDRNHRFSAGLMISGHDLKAVHAEFFEEILMEWRLLPWETLLGGLRSSTREVEIRFRLTWGTASRRRSSSP